MEAPATQALGEYRKHGYIEACEQVYPTAEHGRGSKASWVLGSDAHLVGVR